MQVVVDFLSRQGALTSSQADVTTDYDLGNGNSLTTTVSPGDKVTVKWEDGPWVAELKTDDLAIRSHIIK